MRLIGSTVALLLVSAGVAATVLYLRYGTVQPCGILRERFRQQMVREGGQLGGFVATAIPDNVLDGLLASQYGALTPGHCINLLVNGQPRQPRAKERPSGS